MNGCLLMLITYFLYGVCFRKVNNINYINTLYTNCAQTTKISIALYLKILHNTQSVLSTNTHNLLLLLYLN